MLVGPENKEVNMDASNARGIVERTFREWSPKHAAEIDFEWQTDTTGTVNVMGLELTLVPDRDGDFDLWLARKDGPVFLVALLQDEPELLNQVLGAPVGGVSLAMEADGEDPPVDLCVVGAQASIAVADLEPARLGRVLVKIEATRERLVELAQAAGIFDDELEVEA